MVITGQPVRRGGFTFDIVVRNELFLSFSARARAPSGTRMRVASCLRGAHREESRGRALRNTPRLRLSQEGGVKE